MNKFLKFFLLLVLSTALTAGVFLSAVFLIPPDSFSDTYQSVIQRKYDTLLNTNDPKIIIVGGSNSAFGIDEELIERETGYKVANLGLHGGFGSVIPAQLAKANINKGDIVLLACEWNWLCDEEAFSTVGADLVMSGFDGRLDMYLRMPIDEIPSFIGYLPTFVQQKIEHAEEKTEGVYSSASFDDAGKMTLERQDSMTGYAEKKDIYKSVNAEGCVPSQETVDYLKEYKEFVEKCGASVYFVSPPLLDEAAECSPEAFREAARIEEELIGVPYISDPVEYLLPAEMMFDTIYHCNSRGALYRSQLLVKDLRNAGALKLDVSASDAQQG